MSEQGLTEQIDRSFGNGPDHHPPLEQRIGAGRRAQARRRTGVAAAVVAVVAITGVGYAALAPSAPGRSGEVATAPDPTPTQAPWEDDVPVRYVDGELQVRPGVEVHQHIENPYRLEEPETSDAFDLTFEGQRQWVIIDGRPGAYGLSSSAPSDSWESFEDFVADQSSAQLGDERWRDALRLAEDGAVVPSPGSQILQRADDPRLGDGFAPPGTPTGAALVDPAHSRDVSCVVWRVVDGELEVFRVPPGDVVGATFEELLSYVRGLYAAGEEL